MRVLMLIVAYFLGFAAGLWIGYRAGIVEGIQREQERFRRYTEKRLKAARSGELR